MPAKTKRTAPRKSAPPARREVVYMPLADVAPAPRNPKRHDLAALGKSVDRFGFVEPIVLDERTKRLVAGHGRLEHLSALAESGVKPPTGVVDEGAGWLVPVVRGWRSRNNAEADAYVVASNRLTQLGGWDSDALVELLGGQRDLSGIGYDDAALDALRRRVDAEHADSTDADAEWAGMPEFSNDKRDAPPTVVVHFPTAADVQSFFELLDREPCRVLWWPQHDGHVGSDPHEAYVADDS